MLSVAIKIIDLFTYYTELKSIIRHNLTRFEQYLLHTFKIIKNKQGYETVFKKNAYFVIRCVVHVSVNCTIKIVIDKLVQM